MADLIGKRLGQYEIIGKLGEGGMATVYRARQASINRDVAIKIIESKLASNPDFVKRFQREAQMVASFSNSQILKVFDYGQEGDLIYLVMELLPGGNLADLIKTQTMSLDRTSRLLDQIASALDYAHAKGIMHRDLKPQNVMLDDNGNAILTDFGIAKMLEGSSGTQLTQEGMIVGTPAYMAPEQWQGLPADARSDLYALGIMLFEMLTGKVAFIADTTVGMMFKHLQEPPPLPSSLRSELKPSIDSLITKALAKSPEDRFQSAGAMAQAFKEAITAPAATLPVAAGTRASAGTKVASPIPPDDDFALIDINPPGKRPPMVLIAAGVIVALVVIVAGVLLIGQSGQQSTNATVTAARVQAIALQQTADISGVTQTAQSNLSLTPRPTPTVTAMPIVILTQTVPPTITNTPLPTVTSTFSVTPALQTIVALTIAGRQTATANAIASYTKTATATPTSPPELITAAAIVAASDTALAVENFTKTPTPSSTWTPSATMTPTATFTLTATFTATFTPTVTLSPTASPSPTATATIPPTQTRTPGPTPKLGLSRIDAHGVEQVWVPSGCFQMGSDIQKDPQAQANEQPQHEVCLTKSYWLDRYEVTNSAYQKFIDDNGYSRTEFWSKDGWTWKNATSRTGPDSYGNFLDPNQPRVGITWYEADSYARWRGGHLPTEAEWEYAARGSKSLIYPWGNTWDPSRANFGNNSTHTDPVNKYTNGQSWVFAFNMAGNVWEWCADWHDDAYYKLMVKDNPTGPTSGTERCARGGSFDNDPSLLRSALRNKADPSFQFSAVGVRVASSGLVD